MKAFRRPVIPASQGGFGLVELMIALVLGLLLVLGVTQVFIATKQSFAVQQHAASMQEDARFLLSRLSADLRQTGMFGCLDLQRLPASVNNQMPAAFGQPVAFSSGVLRLITSTPVAGPSIAGARLNAADFDARWLLVSNCLDEVRIDSGNGVTVAAGDIVIPVREIEYRLQGSSIQARLNGAGNFETLIDGVSGFDVQFGLASSAADRYVAGAYVADISGLEQRVRSVRLALSLSDQPADSAAGLVREQHYTLVTALRNRLD